jgi:hypothetical protein
MPNWETEQKAEKLASQIESGDKDGFRKQLDELESNPQARLELARAVDSAMEKHRSGNSSLPDLKIETEQNRWGDTQLKEVKIDEERSNWNPMKLFGDRSESKVWDKGFGESIRQAINEYGPFSSITHALDQTNKEFKVKNGG